MHRNFHHLAGAILFALSTVPAPTHAHEGHGSQAHGNHDPHHGGFVMMHGDLHVELVMPAAGGVQIYYTDAARAELPAAVVSEVAVEIERAGSRPETIVMAISPGGDFWQGAARALADSRAVVRIAFLFNGKPALFNIRAANLPQFLTPAKHAAHHG